MNHKVQEFIKQAENSYRTKVISATIGIDNPKVNYEKVLIPKGERIPEGYSFMLDNLTTDPETGGHFIKRPKPAVEEKELTEEEFALLEKYYNLMPIEDRRINEMYANIKTTSQWMSFIGILALISLIISIITAIAAAMA